MPRKAKVSSAQRMRWLTRHEAGERYDVIAEEEKVAARTVRDQVDRARLERDYEAARREQLREALRRHQEDLLAVMKRIHDSALVPSLEAPPWQADGPSSEPLQGTPLDAGQLSLPSEPSPLKIVLPREPEVMVRWGQDGVQDLVLRWENTRTTRAVREHLTGKALVWKRLAEWKKAVAAALSARVKLDEVVKTWLEQEVGMPVQAGTRRGGRLTSALVRLIRAQLIRERLGEPAVEIAALAAVADGSLVEAAAPHVTLADGLRNPNAVIPKIQAVVEELRKQGQVVKAAQTHEEVRIAAIRLGEEAEGHLLLHHVPGICSLCKKLGGQ